MIQEACSAQRTPEQRRALGKPLNPRAKVERKISEVRRLRALSRVGTS
jgi:hypothetical protein